MDEAQTTERTVSKEELKQAYADLGAYVNGVVNDQPLTMAESPDGKPVVQGIIGTILIGIGAMAIGKKVLS